MRLPDVCRLPSLPLIGQAWSGVLQVQERQQVPVLVLLVRHPYT